MITKERLKALISKQSVIYYLGKAHWDSDSRTHIVKHKLTSARVKALGGFDEILNDKYFFENKDDAQFKRRYGCICRVESISLPSIDELERDILSFGMCGNYEIEGFDDYVFKVRIDADNNMFIGLTNNGELPLTEENYLSMCEKVKKLYKGE